MSNFAKTSSPDTACCKAVAWYDKGEALLNYLQSPFLLLIRLYIGYQSVISGIGHFHNIDATTQFFQSLNIPMPRLNVYISAFTEVVGGGMLLIGLCSRLIAIPLIFNFAVAIVTYEASFPKYRAMLEHLFTDDNFINAVYNDTAFPFFFVSLLVLLFGPGAFSIDHLVLKRLFHRKK